MMILKQSEIMNIVRLKMNKKIKYNYFYRKRLGIKYDK